MSVSRCLGPWWFAVRTSSARILVPIGFAFAVIQSFQGGWSGTGWNDVLQEQTNHCLFLAVAVGTASALDARRFRSTEPAVGSSARALSPVLVPMVAAASWALAAILLLFVTALASTAAVAAWRTPNLLLMAVGCAWLWEVAGIGWLIGWWLPYFLSLPIMLLVGWLVSAALAADTDGWPGVFTGIDDGGFVADHVPSTPVLAAQVITFVVLGLVACGSVRVAALKLAGRLVGVAAVVVALVTVVSLLHGAGPGRRVDIKNASGPRMCTVPSTDVAAVCAWPDDVAAQQVVSVQAAAMWGPLTSVGVGVPEGVVDEGLAAPAGWVTMPMWAPDRLNITLSLAQASVIWFWCGPEGVGVDGADDAELFRREVWLQARAMRVDEGYFDTELREVLRSSLPDQVRWLTKRPAQARCVTR